MYPTRIFADRSTAGRALAERLLALRLADPVVLALPRGGVPVAVEVARALDAPLDLVLVRKIGVPGQPEVAAAAVVDGGEAELVVNDEIVGREAVGDAYLAAAAERQLAEIERRRRVYLAGRRRLPLERREVVVIDDGIATGTTVKAALAAIRRKRPRRVVLAIPVAAVEALDDLLPLADEIICLETPRPFRALSFSYRDFHQLTDDEVVDLLQEV
jgi:putative phosphoribosyl transferase